MIVITAWKSLFLCDFLLFHNFHDLQHKKV